MPKQIAAQIAGDGDECVAGDPTGNPPQQVIRGNQRRQKDEPEPGIAGICAGVKSSRQRIHQNLDAVLRAHRAADRAKDRDQNRSVGHRSRLHVAGEKRKGTIGIPTNFFHAGWDSPVGYTRHTYKRENRLRVSGEPD